MSSSGWHQLLPSAPLFRGAGLYPIDAYSEFTPPPRRGWTPYTGVDRESGVFNPEDPNGWYVDEFDEAGQLQPGLAQIAAQLVERTRALTHGGHGHGFAPRLLYGNVYWPEPLQARTGSLRHDACVVLTPLALSQTIDEFGRLRWTLFGGSDQGPGRAFWKSFADGAASAVADAGPRFLTNLLRTVFRLDIPSHDELAATGFRILPQGQAPLPGWDESLPDWTRPYLADDGADFTAIRYLLTFRPFGQLPASARQAYLEGRLQLLPSPASLVYWGMPEILRLHHELPLALQVPLLLHAAAPDAATGLRVPPAGLLHEPAPGRNDDVPPALVRNTIRRRRRWDRVERDCALPPGSESEDKLLHALFSSDPDDVRLYDKPLARNVQLWTLEGRLLLDGPSAALDDIKQAMETVLAGGVFGYRFVYPALRVGRHEVFWHRTVAAYYCNEKQKALLLDEAPLGYLTCYATVPGDGAGPQAVRAQYRVGHDAWQRPVELWPRLHRRPLPMALLALAQPSSPSDVVAAVRNLVDAYHGRGNTPLPRRLAHDLAAVPREVPLKDWLETLPTANIYDGVTAILEPKETPLPRRPGARTPESLTYHATSRRSFETAFWKLLTILAEGRFLNKNNADCVRDAATQRLLPYAGRHLDALADFLADYHRQKVAATAPNVPAVVGEHRFRWQTDFDYSWMEGWQANQEQAAERNIVVVIPGRDRSRAVVLAAHYDTAYAEDRYAKEGARIASCGADDNASGTAVLLLAAPILLEMSHQGRLGCDVWLVHLTGSEFPADALGARKLTEALVEDTLTLTGADGSTWDLRGAQVTGVFVADTIAHNSDHQPDVFQIAPGAGRGALELAALAHEAHAVWNASVPTWNKRADRHGKPRGRRSPYGNAMPETAAHLIVQGHVRLQTDPRSMLYRSDGQVFSDAGVPTVLITENVDVRRAGIHDSFDTMANIDLDYGAALAAIIIEAVARAAGGTEAASSSGT